MSINATATLPASARIRHQMDQFSFALPIIAAVGLVLFWQLIIVVFGVPYYIVPGPLVVLNAIIGNFGLIISNLIPTAIVAIAGFVGGSLIGVILAIAFVYNSYVEKSFFPIIVFVHTIPTLAMAPILMLILGQGYTMKILIAALICFFPTMVNMVRGLKSITHNTIELMHVLSASKREVFVKVRLPRSLPYLFSSLRIGAQACVTGALVAEWIGSHEGIGALILESALNYRGPLLFASIIAAAALAIALFSLVVIVEKALVRWTASDTR